MKKISIKMILALQLVVMLYTLSSVAAKLASGEEAFSMAFLLYYGVEILILGIYAIAWQQIIKRCDLSVAYANRSMAILWSLIWTVVFFQESLTKKNIIGVMIVFVGTMIVNRDGE
ncbi:MAG: EamA family transporter [Lachnospiraceae bacterium]|nr:EamA family transporter [Lachnospiraceae bacterium]